MIDMRCPGKGSGAHCILHNGIDFLFNISQVLQRLRYGLVDDLEITTTTQFLEFHQCKIGFYTSGIAIHYQTNSTGWCYYGNLCIAVPPA